jgi:signal transduction histidine kinase
MPRLTIGNSSSFRLAATLSALFAGTLTLVFVVVYVLVGYQLRTAMRARVDSEWSELQSAWENGGYDALARSVEERAGGLRDRNSILTLQTLTGEVIAGNATVREPFNGHERLPRSALNVSSSARDIPSDDVDATDAFYLAGAVLDEHFVAVGHSDHDITEAQEILTAGFGIGLVATTLLTLAIGYFLSQRTHSRIAAIRRALERIARGEMNEIVPGAESSDDIGEVVGLVNATVRDLRLVMESIQQISNDIAHDLKKPLGRLQRQLALAAESVDRQSQSQLHLELAQQQAKSIQNVFEALLRIAQIESGSRKSKFGPVDASALLSCLHETFEPVASETGHELLLSESDSAVTVLGDEELLMQLLINLVENSICHTPRGTRIRLAVTESQGGPTISASDDGPGIGDHDRSRITQRFYRCDSSRSDGGSGLGLSLVAAVAALHNARLEFEDNDPGLTVRITFPSRAR